MLRAAVGPPAAPAAPDFLDATRAAVARGDAVAAVAYADLAAYATLPVGMLNGTAGAADALFVSVLRAADAAASLGPTSLAVDTALAVVIVALAQRRTEPASTALARAAILISSVPRGAHRPDVYWRLALLRGFVAVASVPPDTGAAESALDAAMDAGAPIAARDYSTLAGFVERERYGAAGRPPWSRLGLAGPPATLAVATLARNARIRAVHPDITGTDTTAAAALINDAYALIRDAFAAL